MTIISHCERYNLSISADNRATQPTHFGIPALPCTHFEERTRKRMDLSYPERPKSIGDHIRKKRMDLKLLQKDVAKIFDVSEDCITNWEKSRSIPQIQYFPKITEFLGYCPIKFDEAKLSERLKVYRWRNGFSNKKLGKLLNVDGSTILAWENETSIPRPEHLLKFEALYKYWQRHRSLQQ